MRSRACKAAIRALSSTLPDAILRYDGFHVLYSNEELAESSEICREVPVGSLIINNDDRAMVVRDAMTLQITLKLDLVLTNFETAVKDCEREDPVLTHFYASLLRAGAPEDRFVLYRGGKLYDWSQKKEIKKGFLRAPGIHLGIKLVGEGREELTVAVDVDLLQLRAKSDDYWAMKRVERFVRDMVVRLDQRYFTASGLKWKETGEGDNQWCLEQWSEWCTDETRREMYPDSMVVFEEFQREGNTGKPASVCHPLTPLIVLPHSRVPITKQDKNKPPILKPHERSAKIEEARRAIHLHYDNNQLKGYKTHISPNAVLVPYKRLDAPQVYGSREGRPARVDVDPVKHNFNSNPHAFVAPARISRLRILYEAFAFRDCKDKAESFGKRYVELAKSKGVTIDGWSGDSVNDMEALKAEFRRLDDCRREERQKRGGGTPRVMLLVMGCSEQHDDIKRLEHEWRVITQRVEKHTVLNCFGGNNANTLHNIVKKANEKNGGTNVAVRGPPECARLFPLFESSSSPASLIIGLDVCHGEPLSRYQELRGFKQEPSMIGMSSNAATRNLQQFTGCYLPTQSRKEAVPSEVMCAQGRKLMEKFLKNHGKLPTSVIYYRDGVARSQYDMALGEYDALVEGMREYLNVRDGENKENAGSLTSSSSFDPREIVVVCTKEHHLRLFDKSSGLARNPLPGTVVDSGIVSPFYPEFLLVAANVFSGSAKGALTTILRDGNANLRKYPVESLKEMQLLTHSLTFLHGVTDAPTGLPEPVSAAHDLAKRGHNVAKSMRIAYGYYDWTLEQLAEKLSIEGSALDGVKFQA